MLFTLGGEILHLYSNIFKIFIGVLRLCHRRIFNRFYDSDLQDSPIVPESQSNPKGFASLGERQIDV